MKSKVYPEFWDDLKSGKFALMVNETSKGRQVSSSIEMYNILKPISAQHEDQEVLYGVFINNGNQIIAIEKLFTGSIRSSMVFPRELIKRMLALKANSLVLSHNHPSGSTAPSEADKKITRIVGIALASIEARLLDHMIIGDSYYSMAESGFIEFNNNEFKRFIHGE